MEVDLYHPSDVTDGQIHSGAVPVVMPKTSSGGLYRSPVSAGSYIVACHDPEAGLVVTGDVDVKPDTLALFAIDLDHSAL